MGGPNSNRNGCTKFYKGCIKDFKVRFEVGIDFQSLLDGFPNELIDHK